MYTSFDRVKWLLVALWRSDLMHLTFFTSTKLQIRDKIYTAAYSLVKTACYILKYIWAHIVTHIRITQKFHFCPWENHERVVQNANIKVQTSLSVTTIRLDFMPNTRNCSYGGTKRVQFFCVYFFTLPLSFERRHSFNFQDLRTMISAQKMCPIKDNTYPLRIMLYVLRTR